MEHGLQCIHKQIYQHTMNAMPIQHYGQPDGHNAHDAHSLQFSSHCNPVHRPGDQFVNVGKFPFSLRTSGLISALIEELLQQFAHPDGGAIYIPGNAAGLRLREHRGESISAPPWIVARGLRRSWAIETAGDNRAAGSEARRTEIILLLRCPAHAGRSPRSAHGGIRSVLPGTEMQLLSGVYFFNRTFHLVSLDLPS